MADDAFRLREQTRRKPFVARTISPAHTASSMPSIAEK